MEWAEYPEFSVSMDSQAPCRNFSNLWQNRAYQQFLLEILTWESMRIFFYIFLMLQENL